MYQILTDEQISLMLRQARCYGPPAQRTKWVGLMTILVNYGPRVSEALNLTWDDVNFAQGTITFRTLKQRKRHSTKRIKAIWRTLPLLPPVVEILSEHRAHVNGDPKVFAFPQSGRYQVWRAFQKMLVRAGLPRTKTHSLRHSFITRTINTLGVIAARDAAGHADLSTTSIYAHALALQEQFATVRAIT